jgi:hypothetical protein
VRKRIATAAALSAAALATTILTAAAPAQATSAFWGCPAGDVCIYNGPTLDSGVEPGGYYYTYGAHNLSNQEGDHAVINNQTGNAWVTFCGGWNGGGQWLGSEAPNTAYPPYDQDLGPVYSIILTPGAHSSCP